MLVSFPTGDGDARYVVPGNPVKLSNVAPPPDRRGPWLGEHTDDLLRDLLGFDDAEIAALRTEGIIG